MTYLESRDYRRQEQEAADRAACQEALAELERIRGDLDEFILDLTTWNYDGHAIPVTRIVAQLRAILGDEEAP